MKSAVCLLLLAMASSCLAKCRVTYHFVGGEDSIPKDVWAAINKNEKAKEIFDYSDGIAMVMHIEEDNTSFFVVQVLDFYKDESIYLRMPEGLSNVEEMDTTAFEKYKHCLH
ncbi:unnamed protein product [Nippostrongylus brasiliensis]|uniref:Cystatin domain-containing protein n=1 Tax=Nippostrongylus brasiliensis TaxID=27835 RepID=A0A0N4YD74_NIPBR|nr:hypothetical protein Q1695_007137 [Nippostrongylus brasiliensis]VDL78141.1 unnamed protein product [Nippostrongylus brasiliensis]